MNLLIFGSSITWGAWDKEGGWAQRIKGLADNKAISENLGNLYRAVYCLGVSGDNTFDLLERFDTEVKARIDEEDKTSILIEIGINDSQFVLGEKRHMVSPEEYKSNLLKLIDKSKQYGAELALVGLTPVDERVDPIPWKSDHAYRFEFINKFEAIIKEVSKQQNIPFIEVMSKFMEKDYKNLLIDGLHPTTEGHKIIYEEVKKYLEEKGIL